MYEADLQLAERVRLGDVTAETDIIRQHEVVLRKYLLSKSITGQALDDLLNEIWLKVLPLLRQGRYDGSSSLQTFIIGVAKGVKSNWQRKQNRYSWKTSSLHM